MSDDEDRYTTGDLARELGRELRDSVRRMLVLTAAFVPGALVAGTAWWFMTDQLKASPEVGPVLGIGLGGAVAWLVIRLLGGFRQFFR